MLIPSIDLLGGQIVQLVQGEKLRLAFDDFEFWIEKFSRFPLVQLIDLDAAMRKGENSKLVEQIAKRLPVQVGGGIGSIERAQQVLDAGAERVIIGSALFSEAGTVNVKFAADLAANGVWIATPKFELDIVANGQVVGSATLAANTVSSQPVAAGQWYELTATWTAPASGDSITLLASASQFAEGAMNLGHTLQTSEGPDPYSTSDASFDNATLTMTAPAPEPATLTLLAIGLAGLLAYAWRR